ncbi:unnamed protein product [Spirodela intermedia]|uniref:Uncharacterized protein n=1 Tax=Spirodela intermedia TaxID=51605 RepID=A0A7I8K288_SPIIN|nr:unnamed protein product [Spirodela intermedia]
MGFLLEGLILCLLLLVGWCAPFALGVSDGGARHGEGRSLFSYREMHGNVSFRCSASGPCLPCEYSEKNYEKYHCSETGYRVPLKCVEINDEAKETSGKRSRRSLSFLNYGDKLYSLQRFHPSPRRLRWRRLLDTSSESQDNQVSYTTYRSCLPATAEEKVSVLGFEMIMVCLLLVSGLSVYIRQRRSIPMLGIGAGRFPFGSSRL